MLNPDMIRIITRKQSIIAVSAIIIIAVTVVLTRLLLTTEHSAGMSGSAPSLVEQLAVADSLAQSGDSDRATAIYRSISTSWVTLSPHDTINARAAMTSSLVLAQIYFNHYNDYGAVLESLTVARRIATAYGLPEDGLNFLMGTLFFTVAEQNGADAYFDKGTGYFIRVINSPTAIDSQLRHDAASNLILYAHKGNVAEQSKSTLDRYFESASEDGSDQAFSLNVMLDSLMRSIAAGNHAEAMTIIGQMKSRENLPRERVLPFIYFISGEIAVQSGDYDDALRYFKLSESLINPEYGRDMELQVYESLADVYSHLGDRLRMGEYADTANRMRRSITSFSQISSLKNAEIKEEIDSIHASLQQERERSRTLRRWTITGLIFGILTALIIAMLLFFLRRIREKNRTLYLRYVDLLRLRVHRPSYDKHSDEASDAESPVYADDSDGQCDDNAASAENIGLIEHILDTADELYSPNFSAAVMSVMTGVKPRTLSAIIADHYKTSFRHLINSRRIRTVCMRLETESVYDNLTVDAIAESVGIKSRTTFTTAFKKETGMTPAQYIRFVHERKTGMDADLSL